MNSGQYISAGAHLGLIAYVLFGGLFLTPDDSDPVQAQEVSLLSEAEFAALTRANSAPEVASEAPEIVSPTVDAVPDVAPVLDAQPLETVPETPNAAPPDPAPVETPVEVPVEVVNVAPALDPVTEPSFEDPGAGLAEVADATQTPRPVPRIAPEAVVNPDQTPEIADQMVPEVSPDADATAQPVEEQPAAAPEEAVTEIVTEAETPSGMSTSPRPKARPARVTAKAETQQPTEPSPDPIDAVANAVAEAAAALAASAVADTPAAPKRPSGPPLSAGEKDALRVAVSQCWNTGSMSTEAQRTVITVGVAMNQDGTPQTGTIKLLGSSGGSAASADQAFQTARRAIIRCGARGFQLPVEKFEQWRNIEMTFDPEQMRFK